MGLVPSGVGLGYGVCYEPSPLEGTQLPIGRLVFEAVSRPCGSGKLIFTGGHGMKPLSLMADMAFSWAVANREAIEDELGRRSSGPAVLSRDRDLHLNLSLAAAGMVLPPFYCAAMGVALASLLSGRLPLDDVAVSGDLTVLDEFRGSIPTVAEVGHVRLLYDQGFRRLVVGYEDSVVPQALGELARRGIGVEAPEEDDISFTSALPKVFGLVAA